MDVLLATWPNWEICVGAPHCDETGFAYQACLAQVFHDVLYI